MASLVVESGCLKANNLTLKKALEFTSGGMNIIDPESYDCFLLFGLGLNIKIFDQRSYSRDFLASVIKESIEKTTLYNLYLKLKEVTKKKVYIFHNPLKAVNEHGECLSLHSEAHKNYYSDYLNLIDSLGLFEQSDTILTQPLSTIEAGVFTKSRYTKGSVKAEVGDKHDGTPHSTSDNIHMNGEFGAVFWKEHFLKN